MIVLTIILLLFAVSVLNATGPVIRVHSGFIDINDISATSLVNSYAVDSPYTFEIYLDDTMQHDYIIEECKMNQRVFIGSFGCVQCGQCVTESIETESYNKPGAIKRTLVRFVAQSSEINFECRVRRIDCSGCAERSCQRQNQIALSHFVSQVQTVMYPHNYGGNYPLSPPSGFPSSFFHQSGYAAPHPPPPMVAAAPPTLVGGASSMNGGGVALWPWWLWLLLLLLLLLLLCCCLAMCLAMWWKKKKQAKTVTTVSTIDTTNNNAQTEKVVVQCVGTDTNDIVKCKPAIVMGGGGASEHNSSYHRSNMRHHGEVEDSAAMGGQSYSIREGNVHEEYTRVVPQGYVQNQDRYTDQGRLERQVYHDGNYANRSSYRNYGYERDMGRVEPLDGYDEVETREKTYCLSDDEQEIVEKEVKRTHTTRFVEDSYEYEVDDDDDRQQGRNDRRHRTYTHSLPV